MKTSLLKKLGILVGISLISTISFAQVLTGNEAAAKVKGAELVKLNNRTSTIDFVRLSATQRIEESNHLRWMSDDILKLSGKSQLQFIKKETDKSGYSHYKYKQYYNGIQVEYGTYTAHCKDGIVQSAGGEYYNKISISINPTLTKDQAYQKSIDIIHAKKYKPENTAGKNTSKEDGILVVYPKDSKYYLAYKFDIYALEPLQRVFIYIDAQTGELLFQEDRIHTSDVQAVAITAYSGVQEITTDSLSPTNFRLRESGRGNGINTLNLQNGTNYVGAVDFTDNDNVWNTNNIDRYANDAHFGAEKTYDYYFSHFGRDSYDNAGAIINSYVHYSTNYVNAFWDGTQMTYGDGDGIDYLPLTSLDVIGHEITHAVTENTAALVYSGESGALNESFSDVFGNTIRFEYSPAAGSWLIGDQIIAPGSSATPFRNMANPNQYQCADTYGGTYWNNGDVVHYDSGVQNFWYYLLTTGGTGVNDNGNSYLVNGIGIPAAAAIAYRSLSVYLTPNTTFADARFYSIQAAIDLYGSCSDEVIQTTNAWYAVGVGAIFSNAVVAGFSVNQNFFCVLPATANFINNSLNSTSHIWDFGDGSAVSTATNPSHTYTVAGNYTVTLIANGSALCSSTDTVIQTNYISVTNGGGPLSAQCTPPTTTFCCDIGITNLQFGSINNSSNNASDGYKDYTCSSATTETAGDPVAINVTASVQTFENVKAWIDYNNDGIFSAGNELVFVSQNKKNHHTGIVHTSASAVLNTPLRMRVMDDNANNTTFGACTSPQNGQAEDYTITFIANTQAPATDFTSDVVVINVGGTVNFSDLTVHAPTSWLWSFPGGGTTSSTLQNPSIVYNTLGTYQVTLKTTNSFGTDSITKTAYISVVNSIDLCTGITFTTAENGQLYDSGGQGGDYIDGEFCTLLISPNCALSISLGFTQFNTESGYDYLRVYDGVNNTAPLLMNLSGSGLPPSVTANSGQMYIEWSSDFSVTAPGFAAQWTSVAGNGIPPVASFTISTLNPPLAVPVQFTDQTTNLPISWIWDFGDGQTSTDQNPLHAYSNSGSYTVTLISYNCTSSDTVSQTITTQGAPIISLSTDSLIANLSACSDSITLPFTIYNTGTGDLLYTIDESGNGIAGDTSILIIQDSPAWGLDMPNFVQITYGLTPTVITSSQIAATDFILYDIIITVGAQVSTYYSAITANKAKFEAFVTAGGILQYQMAMMGGTTTNLVGGATMNYGNLQNTNNGLLLNHPLLNGISNPLNGNSANHCTLSNLPGGALVISETGTGNLPTTAEYELGNGTVIATGMTWEYLYVNSYNSGQMLPNSLAYLFSKIGGGASWLSVNGTTDTIAPGDSIVVYVTFNSGGLSGGTYTSNIIINSNDPNQPSDTIAAVLNIGFNPCAEYNYTVGTGCSGIIYYNDSSVNNPTSWLWDFGDGNSSTLQSPQHTYLIAGTYNVKLVACNGVACDSITKSVTINLVNGPVSACAPVTTAYCCGMGITNVTLNTLNNNSIDGFAGYQDFSCSVGTNLIIGGTYTITVTTGTLYNENVKAWIDFNNSGTLDPSELILTSTNVLSNHSGTFNVPLTTSAGTLRLRVISDYFSNQAPTSCGNPQYGQAEDYYITTAINTLPPIANFTSNASTSCNGLVQFTDISSNFPTSYSWDFGDGTFSTLMNPTHQYAVAGSYTVILNATNANGTDTYTQTITVNAFFTANPNATGVMLAGQLLQFTANAPGATNFIWNFGDGQISTLQNPTHAYVATGTYYVTVTATFGNCQTIGYDTLYISAVGISELSAINSFSLSPNPFSSIIQLNYHLEKPASVTLECTDVLGRLTNVLLNNETQTQGNYNYSFNPLAAGVYYVKLTVNGESVTRKIVKID